MQSVLEVQALALNTSLIVFEASLDKFTEMTHKAAVGGNPQVERYRRLAHMRTVVDTLKHFPAIMTMTAKGDVDTAAWMLEEFQARITPEFVSSVEECKNIFSQSWSNREMAPLGLIWWVANDCIQKYGKND